MKSSSSRSDYELCDNNGAVKKPVVTTSKPLLNRVSQTTLQFVQEKRVTVSESGSGSTKPKLPTSVNEEFENDEVDLMDEGKVNICDNDHDSALLPLVDHDEMRGMPTTAELNKGSIQLEREVELGANALVDGMDTYIPGGTFEIDDIFARVCSEIYLLLIVV
ncbi:unnamed protein product [Trichobilharzia regenti]|nr:unnamed protein product [Trichobilharzia regenti]